MCNYCKKHTGCTAAMKQKMGVNMKRMERIGNVTKNVRKPFRA